MRTVVNLIPGGPGALLVRTSVVRGSTDHETIVLAEGCGQVLLHVIDVDGPSRVISEGLAGTPQVEGDKDCPGWHAWKVGKHLFDPVGRVLSGARSGSEEYTD